MTNIRPVSDLRNKFSEIEAIVNQGKPVYLTKNGYGAMVVMSLEQFEELTQNVEQKLLEAERFAANSVEKLSLEEVVDNVKRNINENQKFEN